MTSASGSKRAIKDEKKLKHPKYNWVQEKKDIITRHPREISLFLGWGPSGQWD